MRDAVWIAGLLLPVLPGLIFWRLPLLERLDRPARAAIAFAGGITIVTLLLYAYSFAHVPWTRMTLGVPLLVLAAIGARAASRPFDPAKAGPTHTWIFIVIVALLTIYGVGTARETCGDLIYFWGPKGEHFHYAGKIDADFLAFPHYYLMHPDYPPLLPLTYAWASLIAHRFSWWGALFLTPIALLATVAAFRGLAREAVGGRRAGWYSMLLAAILGYGFAIGMVAGAADPLLLLFETIAIAALTFTGERHDAQILAAIALAAAAMTKVEGAAFAAIVLLAYLALTRRGVRAAFMALPGVLALASWIVFSWRYNLLDSYGRAKSAMHFELLGATLLRTLRQASYDVAFVPWIATIAPLFIAARRLQRALLPLLVAAGSIAATIFFYLHNDNPGWWIDASAQRVLLTPLVCLVVATCAASE